MGVVEGWGGGGGEVLFIGWRGETAGGEGGGGVQLLFHLGSHGNDQKTERGALMFRFCW